MLHSGLFKETKLLLIAETLHGALTLEALDYQPMYTYSLLVTVVSQVSYSLLVNLVSYSLPASVVFCSLGESQLAKSI